MPAGGCGSTEGAPTTPGVDAFAGPNSSALTRSGATPRRGQGGGDVLHERARTTEVEVRVGWDADVAEHSAGQTPGDVEVLIAGPGVAVADDAVGGGQLGEQLGGLLSEGVLSAVASSVQPPDLTRRALARQHVQHREHGRGADPGADEHHGPLTGAQHERAARGAGVDHVPDVQPIVQVATPGAVRLLA